MTFSGEQYVLCTDDDVQICPSKELLDMDFTSSEALYPEIMPIITLDQPCHSNLC